MVDYSKAAIKIILDDLKKWSKIFKIGFSIFTLVYFVYTFVMEKGNIYVNIVLISLYVVYTLFELITYKKAIKKAKKIIARSYKWLKLFIKAFTLSSTLYGIYVATSNVDGISIILATLMIIVWILQVLLEIIVLVIEPKVKLIIAGVLTDAKPIINMHNFFTKKEKDWIINYEEYKKEIEILSKRVEETEKVKVKLPFKKKEQKQVCQQTK